MFALHRLAPHLLSLSSVVALGCSGSVKQIPTGTGPTNPDPSQATPDPPAQPKTPFSITWGSCSIPSHPRAITADCATVDAPARRGVDGGETTPVAVYRIPAKKQPATAQMWFLNGGPGGAGFTLAPFAQMVT